MINHQHKYIFIHTPKTGGTSIVNTLGMKDKGHKTQSEIYQSYKGPEDISKYFSFLFVRNPWSRFISLYFYLIRYPKFNNNAPFTFLEYARKFQYGKPIMGSYVEKIIFEKYGESVLQGVWQKHYDPQCNFFDHNQISFIGKCENLQEDFNIICDKTGIPRQTLPHTNETKHKHYTEYYDDETREIVAEKYAKDIEYFGYKFGE